MARIVCTPRLLTPQQASIAHRRSLEVNPSNVVVVEQVVPGRRGAPKRLAVSIANRWPITGVRLTVQFLDGPAAELRRKLLLHMNAWGKTANVQFVETGEVGQVRLLRSNEPKYEGYWSYVGTEILGIEDDEPTMNLEGFTMAMPEEEFTRVVRHEAGHTLGFEHEHMRTELVKRIDPRKAKAFYLRTQGWSAQETDEQVLTPLAKKSIYGTTEADPHSIMCYEIPGSITRSGRAIVGGTDITPKDFAFAAKVYPKPAVQREAVAAPAPPPAVASPPASVAFEPSMLDDSFHIVIMAPPEADVVAPAPKPVASKAAKATKGAKQSNAAAPPSPAPAAAVGQGYLQVLATYGGARVTSTMRTRSHDGVPTRFGEIIRVHERIKKFTNLDSGSLPTDQEMIAFGTDLFETLFNGEVRRLYDEARSRCAGRRLNVVLTSMVPWIGEKPWEFAYDAVRRSFLATEDVHFVRNVMTAIPTDQVQARCGPLRILVASAQPAGFGRLSIEQEVAVIRRGFEPLINAGLVDVEILPRATPGRIHERLSSGEFSVVHFIGHGSFDEKTQTGSLIFVDEMGNQSPLGERSVREIFCQRGIRLVVLNACQSGTGGRADFNKGVAQSLMAHGLPALVANQYSVLDSSATSFAQHFYWALTQGHTLGQAARESRIAVNYSLRGEPIDWAVPVVYARDAGMRICPRPAQNTPAPATTSSRSTTAPRRAFEVAVWDTDNAFPGLDATLAQLNAVQTHFGFVRADLSLPLDAWWMREKAPDGSPYLWADKLAERFARVPLEQRVSALVCITRHWMYGSGDANLFAWWPENESDPGIMILSFAGFDELPAEGPQTSRAIANLLVTTLAGYLAETGTHDSSPRTCPLYYNPKRNLDLLTGKQTFDPGCRKKLAKKLGTVLPAIEAIGKAF
jgi:hypothetical protein